MRTLSFDPNLVQEHLRTALIGRKMLFFNTIDSTNNEAKKRARTEEEGLVVLSERQTAGRGRLGRSWVSPEYKGIWMSLLLKPDLPAEKIPRLTLLGAAAVCLALEELEGLEGRVEVKWPNDILVGGRKAAGILTEMQAAGGRASWVVLGLGLNVNLEQEDFPAEIREVATSLFLETGRFLGRELLAASILNYFEPFYRDFLRDGELREALDICRKRTAFLGRQVLLTVDGSERLAEVLGLGPQGELLVRLAQGETACLVSGEISLRDPGFGQ